MRVNDKGFSYMLVICINRGCAMPVAFKDDPGSIRVDAATGIAAGLVGLGKPVDRA